LISSVDDDTPVVLTWLRFFFLAAAVLSVTPLYGRTPCAGCAINQPGGLRSKKRKKKKRKQTVTLTNIDKPGPVHPNKQTMFSATVLLHHLQRFANFCFPNHHGAGGFDTPLTISPPHTHERTARPHTARRAVDDPWGRAVVGGVDLSVDAVRRRDGRTRHPPHWRGFAVRTSSSSTCTAHDRVVHA
jgi:hypothetical protein